MNSVYPATTSCTPHPIPTTTPCPPHPILTTTSVPLNPSPPLPHVPLTPPPSLPHVPLTPSPSLPHVPLTPSPPLPHVPLTPSPPLPHVPLTPPQPPTLRRHLPRPSVPRQTTLTCRSSMTCHITLPKRRSTWWADSRRRYSSTARDPREPSPHTTPSSLWTTRLDWGVPCSKKEATVLAMYQTSW